MSIVTFNSHNSIIGKPKLKHKSNSYRTDVQAKKPVLQF